MSREPREPEEFDDLIEYQSAQAARIRVFLGTLAEDNDVLFAYIKSRSAVLTDQVAAGLLTGDDMALLMSDDYSRVQKVMSLGSAPQRWLVVWIV